MHLRKAAWLVISLAGCSSTGGNARTNVAAVGAAKTDRDPASLGKGKRNVGDPQTLPIRCLASTVECLPPAPLVHKLCDGVHPDVALYLFRPGTGLHRLYMLGVARPYNASGGVSLLGEDLTPGEEVIALRRRDGSSGAVQVGDSSGYDVLRWNGACVTIHDGDFTSTPPHDKHNARVEWNHLTDQTQHALIADAGISETVEGRRRTCHGVSLGIVSKDCETFDRRLVGEVVRYVRAGAPLPEPALPR